MYHYTNGPSFSLVPIKVAVVAMVVASNLGSYGSDSGNNKNYSGSQS